MARKQLCVHIFMLFLFLFFAGVGESFGDTNKPASIIKSLEKNMVLIPAGEFTMGGEGAENEYPPHRVYLDAFYIGKYEVAFEEYLAYCKDTGYSEPIEPFFLQPDESMLGPTKPVMNVRRNEAEAFCQWLSGKTGKHYRLPSEAEWEKAARGGLEEMEYPWGDDPPKTGKVYRVNYGPGVNHFVWKKDGYEYTAPVGSYPPNGYGLHDMAGNVWEWCQDWYDDKYYEKSPSNNPRGPDKSWNGVIRGGCFGSGPEHLRCSKRQPMSPKTDDHLLGFRIARDP